MEHTSIYAKIADAQAEIGRIAKDSFNPHFKNQYFDINTLIAQVNPALHKHGLALTQPITDGFVHSIITDTETGDQVQSSLPLPDAANPQAMGSALTYYRRYTLVGLLALPAEDDDGNASRPAKQQSKPEPKPAAPKAAEPKRDPAVQTRAKVLLGRIQNAEEHVKAMIRAEQAAMAERGTKMSWSFAEGRVWTADEISTAEAFYAQAASEDPPAVPESAEELQWKLMTTGVTEEQVVTAYNEGPGFTNPVDALVEITDTNWLREAAHLDLS